MASSWCSEPASNISGDVVVMRTKIDRRAVIPNERRSSMIEVLMRQRRDNAENHPKGPGNNVSSTAARQSISGGTAVVDLPIIAGGKPLVSTLRPSSGDIVKGADGVAERRRSSCYQSVILSGPFSSATASTGSLLRGDRTAGLLQTRRNSLSVMSLSKKTFDDTSMSASRAGVLRAINETRRENGFSKITMNQGVLPLNNEADLKQKAVNGGGKRIELETFVAAHTTENKVVPSNFELVSYETQLASSANDHTPKMSDIEQCLITSDDGKHKLELRSSMRTTGIHLPASSSLEVPLELEEHGENKNSCSVHDDAILLTSVAEGVSIHDPEMALIKISTDLQSSPTVEVPHNNDEHAFHNTHHFESQKPSSTVEVPHNNDEHAFHNTHFESQKPSSTVEVPHNNDDHAFHNNHIESKKTSAVEVPDDRSPCNSVVDVLLVTSDQVLTHTDTSLPCSPNHQEVHLNNDFSNITDINLPPYPSVDDIPIDTLDQVPRINFLTFPIPTFDATPNVLNQVLLYTNENLPISCAALPSLDNHEQISSYTESNTPSASVVEVLKINPDQELSHTTGKVSCSSTQVVSLEDCNPCIVDVSLPSNVEVFVDTFDQTPSINLLSLPTFKSSFDVHINQVPDLGVLSESYVEECDNDIKMHNNSSMNFASPTVDIYDEVQNEVLDKVAIDLPISATVVDVPDYLSEVMIEKGNLGLGFCIGESIGSAGNHSIFIKRIFTSDTCIQGRLLAGDEVIRVNNVEMKSISSAAEAWKLIKSISNEPIRMLVRRKEHLSLR